MKCNGIKGHLKEETYSRDPSHSEIESLSYRPGDLQDPRTFPHCSRAASSRYSVPASPSRGVRHFLLLVSNMGRFSELTLVCRQTTESWLPTPGAGDKNEQLVFCMGAGKPVVLGSQVLWVWVQC